MRKIVLILLLFILMSESGLYEKSYKKTPLFYDAVGTYTVTVGKNGSLSKFYSFSTDEMDKFYGFERVYGESVRIKNEGYKEVIIKRYSFEKVLEERVGDIAIEYYFSDEIPFYKSINGKKVNLQTVKNGEEYVLGAPIIYGSF